MGFLDKAKNAAEQATTKAKEGIGEVQTRRELGQAYDDLGKLSFDLADAGEISNDQISELVEKIRGLKAQLDAA